MAHSSGGGSSGGGCHSGSSNGSSSRDHVYYRYPAPGAQRYSYLDRSGEKRYFYSRVNPAEYKLTNLIMPLILLALIVFGAPSLNMGYFTPKKLDNPGAQILIDDRLNVIRDEDRFRRTLEQFYDETGVVPAVQTIAQEDWNKSCSSLEDYALREYYELFQDEVHWLIVYSAPADESGKIQLSQWSFEGAIGDDAGPSVNDPLCYQFTRNTYDSLKEMNAPEKAIAGAFKTLLRSRKPGFYTEQHLGGTAFLLILIQWGILLIWPVTEFMTCYEAKIKYRNAVLDE